MAAKTSTTTTKTQKNQAKKAKKAEAAAPPDRNASTNTANFDGDLMEANLRRLTKNQLADLAEDLRREIDGLREELQKKILYFNRLLREANESLSRSAASLASAQEQLRVDQERLRNHAAIADKAIEEKHKAILAEQEAHKATMVRLETTQSVRDSAIRARDAVQADLDDVRRTIKPLTRARKFWLTAFAALAAVDATAAALFYLF